MTSYLVQGLLSNTTSILTEGFSINLLAIKLFIYLNSFNINYLSTISYLAVISNTKLNKINTYNTYSKITILNKNKLVKYKINSNSYLNKINVN